MASEQASIGPNDVPCPDPSVHERSHHQHKLSEQASTAALYATQPERERATESRSTESREHPLGADGKLSSKSAAASLKYAKPQDLPSFPSHGNAADSAGKAAMLAKDYKMKDLWHPEQSLAGSKAALLAHGKGGKLELWQASATADGQSAATLAMRNKGLSPSVDYGVTPDSKNKALRAATMSHQQGRQRAGSTPAPVLPSYPDAQNSSANALNAATVSHSASVRNTGDGWNSDANQAARIKNLGNHMDREMFGEHPPVQVERDEAQHKAALRASAVSMAKQIYETQNRTAMTSDPADVAGAQAAAARTTTTAQPDIKQEAMRYINLQEAAHKLAAERLAKVDKNFEAAQYREYYGYGDKPKRLSSRLSLRSGGGRQRHRASSEGTADVDDSDDEEQARRIRSQMSQLNSGFSKVDEKKQQDDRAKVLAAAEKRVSARMHTMDEKVFADTGKVPPALMEEWEEKARERAQREREQQAQNPGKTHIGGGKFMDQSEIEAIAAARLKPTLDEINDTADKRRARDEELKMEKEEQERQKREEKAKNREEKEEQKRIKNEEKAATKKEKDEERARKEEEKRVAKEEKRKSRDVKREEAKDAVAASAAGATLAEVADKVKEDDEPETGDAAEGVQKHRSALSRLKEKFRRSHADDGGAEHRDREAAAAVTTTGAAAGATTGATLADHSHQEDAARLDSQQAAHAVGQDDSDKVPISPEPVSVLVTEPAPQHTAAFEQSEDDADDEDEDETNKWKPVAVPTTVAALAVPAAASRNLDTEDSGDGEPLPSSRPARPPFEQTPSLSGYHNDEIPHAAKPDLERHISQIPESDDGDSSDDEWDDERKVEPAMPLGEDKAQTVAARVADSPVANAPMDLPNTIPERTAPQLDEQRADPPQDLPSTLEPPGVPKATAALTDPVTTDPEVQLETDAEKKDHSILRQVINPHGKKYDEQAFGTTAHAATVGDSERSTTIKQQESTEPAKLKKKQEPFDATDEQDKERKGLRGFINKLRHKDSKSENKAASDSNVVSNESTTGGDELVTTRGSADVGTATTSKTVTGTAASTTLPPVDAGPSLEEHVGTDGPIGDSKHVSGLDGNPRAESPSSFRRGEGRAENPDDVSSSGADEEDVSRGRAGRLARKLGLGSRKGKGKATDTRNSGDGDRQNSEGVSGTEDDQFEEARDHFDETLAPPPAFAGQAKSESPVRETRFQEQL